MGFLSHFYIAFLLSVLMMPVCIRLGRRLGIVDRPDPRKVHSGLIPRTGGAAIALAVVASLLSPQTVSRELAGYLSGAIIILFFGLWDDMRELGYRVKFLGQTLAILAFALLSGSQVCSLGELLPGMVVNLGPASILVTVVFMLAVINIINLSDGLDGLAGGLSLLILLACALLGYMEEVAMPVAIALTVCGGLVGFMRYNVHPAEVFMGDTGSQFLGYTIGACLIMLTQNHSIYSPVLPLFLLGTPILDTAMVMYERIRAGRSPFKPDKNHLHHKLLRAGLTQEQTVACIYALHFGLILSGFALRFAEDYLVFPVYIFVFILFETSVAFHVIGHRSWMTHEYASKLTKIFHFQIKTDLTLRGLLSSFCWKIFFISYFIFVFINLLYIYDIKFHFFIPSIIFIILIIYMKYINTDFLYSFIYYSIFIIILYISIYSNLYSIEFETTKYFTTLLNTIYFILIITYFGCIILTPEKMILNSLDIVMIGSIILFNVIPENYYEIKAMNHVIMKSVALGLGLNLIYSRIARNKRYVFILACTTFAETGLLALF